ncbi:hypothetical protein HYX15_02010 [Candidatus Woesearchaeota archaeon]|nr:hypothetical protein [Candidatus Woesearchaeota archaeon]
MLKRILLLLILISPIIYAAEIRGTIYDEGLDKVKDSIIEVNSQPKQKFVSKDGTYSFTLPKGDYIITARFEDLTAQDNITIKEDGVFILDLFLFPDFEDDFDADIEVDNFNDNGNLFVYSIYALGLIVIIGLVIYKYKFYDKGKISNNENEIVLEEDEILNRIMEIMEKNNGRTTQKDIRKEIKLSEAKISLALTELEHKGKLKKIKKGRGNVIILQR